MAENVWKADGPSRAGGANPPCAKARTDVGSGRGVGARRPVDDFRPLLDELDARPIHSEVFGDVAYGGRDRETAESMVVLAEMLVGDDDR